MTMAPMPQVGRPKNFKSQPWVLFDTVAAFSFLRGDTTANGLAIGSQTPAVNMNGEIVFFQGGGRTTANYPWYTNLDVSGQLAYGFEVWQIYLLLAFPVMPFVASVNPNPPASAPSVPETPTTLRLAESIINFGVLEFELGQENQTRWPLTRFGAGGGLHIGATFLVNVQNSEQQAGNIMGLPEPIEMPRTQNLSMKIRLAAEVLDLIGTVAAPGVGAPLLNQDFIVDAVPTTVSRRLPPYAIQLGLKGRRIKNTQYGQIPQEQG
jgi:hypothetical protein